MPDKSKFSVFSNVLLISGSGRNIGKTTLACYFIEELSKQNDVIGLKISPHIHTTGNDQELIYQAAEFSIYRENNRTSTKDSARMLNAGAKEVYFVQCTDENLWKAGDYLNQLLPQSSPVVCESGSFASIFKPGYHILVEGTNADESKVSYIANLKKADIIISQEDVLKERIEFQISYDSMGWRVIPA